MNKFELLYMAVGFVLALIAYFSENLFFQVAAGLALMLLFIARTIIEGLLYSDR